MPAANNQLASSVSQTTMIALGHPRALLSLIDLERPFIIFTAIFRVFRGCWLSRHPVLPMSSTVPVILSSGRLIPGMTHAFRIGGPSATDQRGPLISRTSRLAMHRERRGKTSRRWQRRASRLNKSGLFTAAPFL